MNLVFVFGFDTNFSAFQMHLEKWLVFIQIAQIQASDSKPVLRMPRARRSLFAFRPDRNNPQLVEIKDLRSAHGRHIIEDPKNLAARQALSPDVLAFLKAPSTVSTVTK
jgi:hypothetical protein